MVEPCFAQKTSTANTCPDRKKGGVNLPRHRVEHCFIDKVSGIKYPGRKKGGSNLPGYRVAHPMLYIKKGEINNIYPEPCCIFVIFSACADCLSLFLLRCFHNYKCYIHATFPCFYCLLLISCNNCSKAGTRILANKSSFSLTH
jgi:hypothetical protein